MSDQKTTVTTTKRTTINIEEDEVARILREYFKAPANASVKFDSGGYSNYLDHVEIEWEESVTE